MITLEQLAARMLVHAGVLDISAMKPYKPKTATEKKIKTDPAHRMKREAYKRRSSQEKREAERYRKEYYRKNKSQLHQRQRKSRMLHKKKTKTTAAFQLDDWGIWTCSYNVNNARFGVNIYGSYEEALSHALNLELHLTGQLCDVIPASMDGAYGLDTHDGLAQQFVPGYGSRQQRIQQ